MESRAPNQRPIKASIRQNISQDQVYFKLLSNCYDPSGSQKSGFLHFGKQFRHSTKQCESKYHIWLLEQESKAGRFMHSVMSRFRRFQTMDSEQDINQAIKSDTILDDITRITNGGLHGFNSTIPRLILFGLITEQTLTKQIQSLHFKLSKTCLAEEAKVEEQEVKIEPNKKSKLQCMDIKGDDEPIDDQENVDETDENPFLSPPSSFTFRFPTFGHSTQSLHVIPLFNDFPHQDQSDSFESNIQIHMRSFSEFSIDSTSEYDFHNPFEQQTLNALKQNDPLLKSSAILGELCAICQDEFKEGQRTLDLKVCEHQFHVECIKSWLKKKAICPLCKRKIPK